MQELQVMLKCGQPLSIRNTSEMKEILPEFRRFLDEVRLSADSKTEKMFVFSAPYLVVRLTEVGLCHSGVYGQRAGCFSRRSQKAWGKENSGNEDDELAVSFNFSSK